MEKLTYLLKKHSYKSTHMAVVWTKLQTNPQYVLQQQGIHRGSTPRIDTASEQSCFDATRADRWTLRTCVENMSQGQQAEIPPLSDPQIIYAAIIKVIFKKQTVDVVSKPKNRVCN